MIAELGISLNNFMDALSYNRVKALDYNRNLSISDLVSKTQYTTLAEMHGIVNASTNDTSIIKKIWNDNYYMKSIILPYQIENSKAVDQIDKHRYYNYPRVNLFYILNFFRNKEKLAVLRLINNHLLFQYLSFPYKIVSEEVKVFPEDSFEQEQLFNFLIGGYRFEIHDG